MVITGGILALICPVEYYKRHAEIPRYKNNIKAISYSAQNKAGTEHSSIRNRSGCSNTVATYSGEKHYLIPGWFCTFAH